MSTELHPTIENFWRVAEAGDMGVIESVLAAGVDIDACNSHGMTALMRAASHGRVEMVRLLLKHGADPNRARNDKFTALVLASFFGHEEIVKILVEHGANIDAATRFGTSAQGWASARTFPDVAEYLKTNGVNHSRSQIQHPAVHSTSEDVIAATTSVEELQVSLQAVESHDELPPGPEPFQAFDADAIETPVESETPVHSLEQPEAFPAIFEVLPKPLNRKRVIYAFATLLLAFALFAHLTLLHTHSVEVAATDTPTPTLANPVPSSANVISSLQPKSIAPAEAQVESLATRDVNNSYKKPEKEKEATVAHVTRELTPTSNSTKKQPREQRNQTVSVSQPPPTSVESKVPEPKVVSDAVLATAPTTIAPSATAKPKPVVPSESTPKMRPAPSTQLLTGTKGADKGREIRWP